METSSAVFTLWPHQIEAVEAAAKQLTLHDRVHDILACGTGKTILGRVVADAVAPNGRTLAVVPRINLITQTLHDYRRLDDAGLGRVLIICSDPSVARDPRLAGLDTVVTTDPAAITRLVSDAPGRVTVVATYDSTCEAVMTAHAFHALPAWDLVQLDEAHHTVGTGAWTRVHSDAHLPARRRRYTTATAKLLTARRGGDTEAASMNDPAVFGVRGYELGFHAAIRRGLLAPFRVVVPVVTDSQVHDLWDRSAPVRVGRAAVSADVLAAQIAALKAMREFGAHRALSFHPRVAAARLWTAVLPQAAALLDGEHRVDVAARHLNSTHRAAQRTAALDWFSAPLASPAQVRVLTNVRLFREGFNAPRCDAVVLTHRVTSVVDLVQTLSRAMRVDPDNPAKTATFVVPVRSRDGQSLEESLTAGGWDALWQALRALGSMDETVSDRAAARLRHRGAAKTGPPATGVPEWLHLRGAAVPEGFAEAIGVAVARTLAPGAEEYLGAAQAFRAEYGHLDIPAAHTTANQLGLGKWLVRTRAAYRAGTLAPDTVQRLEALGVVWEPRAAARRILYERAKAHVDVHGPLGARGRLTIGVGHVTADGYPLGLRLQQLRDADRRGTVTDAEKAEWEALGFVWQPLAESGEQRLRAAQAFHREHGHLRVPQEHVTADGEPLGQWINQLRRRHRNGTLPAEEARAWEQLGMVWHTRDHKRAQALDALKEFATARGHLDICDGYTTADGFALGAYLRGLKDQHARGTLNADTVEALTALGVVWNRTAADRAAFRRAVEEFHAEHGHLAVLGTYTTPDGIPLGRMLAYRRSRRRDGLLAADEEAWLTARGMVWSTANLARRHRSETAWDRAFETARHFHDQHGHLNTPNSAVPGPDGRQFHLRSWLTKQRARFTDLPAARRQQLLAIGFTPTMTTSEETHTRP